MRASGVSLYSVNFLMTLLMGVLEYMDILWLGEKMITATSASHRTESSVAFLIRPLFLLMKVTCRWRSFWIRTISIFLRPMVAKGPSRAPAGASNSKAGFPGRASGLEGYQVFTCFLFLA